MFIFLCASVTRELKRICSEKCTGFEESFVILNTSCPLWLKGTHYAPKNQIAR
jgi:hypothetical protein